MKRIISLGVLTVLSASVFIGCGTETNEASAPVIVHKVPAHEADVSPKLNPLPGAEVSAELRDLATLKRLRSLEESSLADTTSDALGRIGRASVPALAQRLKQSDPEARKRALRILARIGPEAEEAVGAIATQLRDPDEEVRKLAVRALGQIGSGASTAVPELMRIFDEGEEQ